MQNCTPINDTMAHNDAAVQSFYAYACRNSGNEWTMFLVNSGATKHSHITTAAATAVMAAFTAPATACIAVTI